MKINKIFSKKYVLNVLFLLCFTFSFTFLLHVNASAATTPTGLAQTDGDDDSVTVTWNSQLNDNIDYYYSISDTNTFNSNNVANTYSYDCTKYFYGLQSGRTYFVWIGAKEDEAPIIWSSPIAVVTAPTYVDTKSVQYTNATETSFSLSWNAVAGASGYKVSYYVYGTYSDTAKVVDVGNSTSATLTGLANNTDYEVKIAAYRTAGSYVAISDTNSIYTDFYTLPTKVTGVDCDYFNTSVKQGKATFSWDKNPVATGYQYEIYKYNGKKKLLTGTVDKYSYDYASVSNSKLKPRQIYKIRVRAFVNTANNTKKYGAWSSYDYFSRCADTDLSLKKSSGKIKASWSKVTGATSYYVYMSTKYNGGYKKVATTTKTSLVINKTIKSGKYYYVRIVPNYKSGKTTYSATVNSNYFYSAYVYTSKYGWHSYTY